MCGHLTHRNYEVTTWVLFKATELVVIWYIARENEHRSLFLNKSIGTLLCALAFLLEGQGHGDQQHVGHMYIFCSRLNASWGSSCLFEDVSLGLDRWWCLVIDPKITTGSASSIFNGTTETMWSIQDHIFKAMTKLIYGCIHFFILKHPASCYSTSSVQVKITFVEHLLYYRLPLGWGQEVGVLLND